MAVVLSLLLLILSAVTSYAATGAPAPPLFDGGTGSAATHWATPGGPNGAGEACTEGDPCGLDEATSRAFANHTVMLKDGDYNNEEIRTVRDGTAGNHIIFKAENSRLARIITNDQNPVLISHDYITIQGLYITDNANGDEADAGIRLAFQGGNHHIIIDDVHIFHTGDVNIRATGNTTQDNDIIIRNSLLDGCGYNTTQNPDPKNDVDGECIYMGGGGAGGVDNVMIYDNEIRDWTSNSIDMKANVTDVWIYGNIIHSSVDHAVHGAPSVVEDGAVHLIGSDVYFYNNILFNLDGGNRVFRTRAPNNGQVYVYNNVIYDAPNVNEFFEADSGNGDGFLFNNTLWDLNSYAVDGTGYNLTVNNNLGVGTGDGLTIAQMNANWFVNAAAGQFQLTANATLAIDAADTDPFSATDHDGAAISGAERDVGAYEFSGAITMAALNAAIDAAGPGAVITVADNTYNNPGEILIDHDDNCTQAAPCTIMAETTGQWIITGNTSGFKVNGDWWIIKGFVVQNQTGHLNSGWMEMYSAQNVVVEDCRFTGQTGGWDFAFTFGNEPDVEQGLNITVQDCEFDNWAGADNWIFDWNVRSNNHIHTGLIWRRNHMHDLNFDAGSALGANNLGNFVGRAGTDCDGLFEDNIWERISADNPQDNCFFHPKCSGLTFKNEIFRDSPECAIRLRQGYGNVLDGNLFENLDVDFNTAQVWVSGGEHKIINNVFNPKGGSKACLELTEGCILASATDAECSTEADPDNDCHYIASSGTIIANNTFIGCDTESVDLNEGASSNQCDPVNVCPQQNILENNILYHNNGGVAFRDAGCTQQTVDDNLFHLAGGATVGLQGTRADFDNPDFVDVGGDNFNLTGTSPAIDAGHNVAGTTLDAFDILGVARPQGGEYDFGAYEFDGADMTPPCVPQNLVAMAVSSTQIDLTWDACPEPDLQDYIVQRCIGSGCSDWATVAVRIPPSFSNTSLTPGLVHVYRVQSRDTTGNLSAFSATAEATPSTFYYLDPVSGVDQAGCGLGIGAAACATWATLNTEVTPAAGDIVCLLNPSGTGELNEKIDLTAANSGTSGNPLVLDGQCGGQSAKGIVDGTGVTIPAFEGLVFLATNTNYVHLKNLEIRDSDDEHCVLAWGIGTVMDNLTVHDCGGPTQGSGILFEVATSPTFNVVRNSEIYNTYKGGIVCWQVSGGYFLFEKNVVHDIGGNSNFDGIETVDCDYVVVQDNTVYSVGPSGDLIDIGGNLASPVNHVVVQRNLAYRGPVLTNATDLKVNREPEFVIVRHNRFRYAGMEFYEPALAGAANKFKMYHNTITETGMDLVNQNGRTLRWWNGDGQFFGVEAKNNAFILSDNYLIEFQPNNDDGSFSIIKMVGNAYKFGFRGFLWHDPSGPKEYAPNAAGYAAWRSEQGQEPGGGVLTTQTLSQLFVNVATYDFTPTAVSDLIDAGVPLTTTTSAGTGTDVTVVDSTYFFDGYGLTQGDSVQIGSNPPVQISSINEGAHTLTLATSISWSTGDSVNLPFSGAAPDIGAIEFVGTPALPAGVVIQPGTFNGGTFR